MGLASRFFFVLVSFLSRPVNRRNELKSISAPSRMSFFERNIFPYVTSQLLLLVSPLPILWTILPLLLPIKKEPLEHFAQINFFVDRSCNGYLGVHLGVQVQARTRHTPPWFHLLDKVENYPAAVCGQLSFAVFPYDTRGREN